ncbi:hypothetical protein EYC79_18205 [Agrobacterium cavarae]|uniref:Tail fiber protein n=1 Tax=Agrobacterium cavarae TaxID=2528239 RepID=A0ABY1Y5E8_9HYPH|nr:hypothetical protein [Agrobacterium cavarae]TBN10883.1 hypothetical protein EYC79_18205 [Agrobacterium cavarae]
MAIGTIGSKATGADARAKINAGLEAIDGLPKNAISTTVPTMSDDEDDGFSVNSKWLNSATGIEYICRDATAGAASWVRQDNADFFGYTSGNYYQGINTIVSGGAAVVGGQIKFHPIVIKERVTISELAVRVTTSESGKAFQLAIYAADPVTKLPSGNVLGATANMSAGTTGAMSGALVGGNVTLNPGLYWMGINGDTTTAVFQAFGSNSTFIAALLGGTASQVASGTASSVSFLGNTQAFGVWPDLTGQNFSRGNNSGYAGIFFKVA